MCAKRVREKNQTNHTRARARAPGSVLRGDVGADRVVNSIIRAWLIVKRIFINIRPPPPPPLSVGLRAMPGITWGLREMIWRIVLFFYGRSPTPHEWYPRWLRSASLLIKNVNHLVISRGRFRVFSTVVFLSNGKIGYYTSRDFHEIVFSYSVVPPTRMAQGWSNL